MKPKPPIDEVPWNEDLEPCVYCGVAANSIDHVPPKSARQGIIDAGLAEKHQFFEVPCCRECNGVLGRIGLWTLSERRAYIAKALRRRYAHFLNTPDWTDEDLAQLAPKLRQYVTDGLKIRQFIRQRIAYARR